MKEVKKIASLPEKYCTVMPLRKEETSMYSRSDNRDLEICEKYKSFEKLSDKEIDKVAAKIRKISPKFEGLNRPDIIDTRNWLEYVKEGKKIASLPENFCTVMPLRKEEIRM